jgi:hypothetical protein
MPGPWTWGALALLWGCTRPPSLLNGLDPVVANAIQGCDRLGEEQRDWCAVQFLGPELATGPAIYELCRRLEEPLARDRCLEVAVRNEAEPAPAVACDSVADPVVRQACRVSAARAAAGQDLRLAGALCLSVPAVAQECAMAAVEARAAVWVQDRAADPPADVAQVVAQGPALAWSPLLARTVGATARAAQLVVSSEAL